LNISVIDQEGCKRQVRLEIPGETVRVESDKVAANLARKINIPGFRPGHVPKSVVKTRFRKEVRDEAVQKLLPQALTEAIQEKDLKVVGEPALDELKFNDDESIAASFTVEVSPDFDLAPYTSLPLTKRLWNVSDEAVAESIQSLRERHAELVPVEDRPAQTGDLITANMTGRIVGKGSEPAGEAGSEGSEPGEPGTGRAAGGEARGETIETKEVEIELGAKGVFPEFNEAIVGARPGDVKTMSVQYPDDYQNEKIAGHKVEWTAEVTAIRLKELPELDDEFAGTLEGEFASVREMRDSIRDNMEHEAAERADADLRTEAMKVLADRNRFEVPQSVVNKLVDSRMASFARSMYGRGRRIEDLGIDPMQLREIERARATDDVRGMYILQRIAEVQNIEATDDDVAEEIERLATASGKTVEVIKARLTKDEALDSIKEQIENRKALDFVIASAEIRTVDGATEEAEHGQTSDGVDEGVQAEGGAALPE
jgi:trigger factor